MYAYGDVYGFELKVMAEAFLKLLLLAPRLLLHSSRGVTKRVRVLLAGKVKSFNSLYEVTYKPSTPAQPMTNAICCKKSPKLFESCSFKRHQTACERTTTSYHFSTNGQNTCAITNSTIRAQNTRFNNNKNYNRFFTESTLISSQNLRLHAAPDTTGLSVNHIKLIFRG